jgi:dTDP-4-dehydrorhamnose 3,5-epimerase
MPFQFTPLAIAAVILVEPRRSGDARGFFMETYKRSDFMANGIAESFAQDNYSRSARGVLRGLHYQLAPQAQGKLVTVVHGEVFDVAVDIRPGSPTFSKWVGVILSAEQPRLLYIPPGFAHGFCVISPSADFAYKVTSEYSQAHERGILWNDPQIAIEWPITTPVLSGRDAQLPRLRDAEI